LKNKKETKSYLGTIEIEYIQNRKSKNRFNYISSNLRQNEPNDPRELIKFPSSV